MQNNKKLYFLCFAGGDIKYIYAQKRLLSQIETLNIFHQIIGLSIKDLDSDYFLMFQDLINDYNKGFGLWSWKPWIIHQQIKKMNHGDILLYLDVGFEINVAAKTQIFNYINEISENKFMVFDNGRNHAEYTKPDLRILNFANKNKNQVSAAFIALEKCKFSEDIINNWLKLSSTDKGELLKEEMIIDRKKILFPKHRHDQSVLTSVLYNFNYEPYSPDPTYNVNWKLLINSPFINFRNYSNRPVVNLELSFGLSGILIKVVRYLLLTFRYRKLESIFIKLVKKFV